jgi:hypothetical protein
LALFEKGGQGRIIGFIGWDDLRSTLLRFQALVEGTLVEMQITKIRVKKIEKVITGVDLMVSRLRRNGL